MKQGDLFLIFLNKNIKKGILNYATFTKRWWEVFSLPVTTIVGV